MPTVNPSPFGAKPQFFDASGAPDLSYKLFAYVAGSTSTKQDTYTNSTGTVANTNPIVLNALGQTPNELWFVAGEAYKIVLAPSTDTDPPTNPVWTIDSLRGINDVSQQLNNSEWILFGAVPTYVNSTTLTIPGNQTAIFQPNRRVQTVNTAGIVTSTILTSVFGTVTTLTLANSSGVLDSGLGSISYGILAPNNSSVPVPLKGAVIASAATTLIFTDPSIDMLHISGSVGINSLGGSGLIIGYIIKGIFDGAPLITPSASLILNGGGASIQIRAGDTFDAWIDTAGLSYMNVTRANGTPITTPPLRNYIAGLTLSTAGSSTTISIAAGQAADSTNTALMNLAAAISKTTSAWAAGTGNGGLDTGTIVSSAFGATCSFATNIMTCTVAPTSGAFKIGQEIVLTLVSGLPALTKISSLGTGTGGTGTYNLSTTPGTIAATTCNALAWYYNYLIQRPDTGAIDVIFSTSPVAPTLPTNYTLYRYIGSTLSDISGNWTAFTQVGNEIYWQTPVLDINALVGSTTAALATLSVPRGRKVKVFLNAVINGTTGSNASYISDPDNVDLAPSITLNPLSSFEANLATQINCWTNISAQIRHREVASANNLYVSTIGWIDQRGMNA